MATIPEFDSLAQGLGYANVPTPTSDAAGTDGLPSSEGTLGSTNDPPTMSVLSLETKSVNAPESGAFLQTNLHQENWCDPMIPVVGIPER